MISQNSFEAIQERLSVEVVQVVQADILALCWPLLLLVAVGLRLAGQGTLVDAVHCISQGRAVIGWDNVAVLIDHLLVVSMSWMSLKKFGTYSSLCSNANLLRVGDAVQNSLASLLHNLDLARLSADPLQVLEVAILDGSDVLAAKDADFEFLRLRIARRETSACALEIFERLEDDIVCTDVLRDSC